MGSKVELIGVAGKDEAGRELKELLKTKAIKTSLTYSDKTTVHKLRLSAGQQQLLRLDKGEIFLIKETGLQLKVFLEKN
ncbi:MAG: hypothetical protein Ct9H300mP3_10270 [Gammaproteobacteria bacterium]|nr:MAG: hypothetical protein Ct9H300mP3_10270 [Gammaproteobacteria bacterium]